MPFVMNMVIIFQDHYLSTEKGPENLPPLPKGTPINTNQDYPLIIVCK